MQLTKVQRTVLIISTITSFLGPFLISSVTVALPSIENDFQLSSFELGWIINSFLLSSAILLLPAGKLADQFGQVKIYRLGIFIFTASTLLCGISNSTAFLITFRTIQGIGAAMTMTTGPALLVSKFPGTQRGRVLGINVASVYLGLSTGPYLGGLITDHLGWRNIFLISAPIGLIVTFLTLRWLKNETIVNNKNSSLISSTFFYGIVLFLFVYGASSLPQATGIIMISCFFILAPVFILSQYKKTNPLLPVKLFRNNILFSFSNLAALINYSGTFANIFYLSIFLQKIHHLSPQITGAILVIQPITQAILSPVSGHLSDRVEPRFLATMGMVLNALGLALLAFININTPITYISIYLLIMGVGFALFSSPNMNTIMGSVNKDQLGMASGISATMRIIGQMVSMSLAALLFSLSFNKTPVMDVSNDLFLNTYNIALIIMSCFCVIGSLFSFFRGEIKKTNY
ncbi:MAG: MFS transporter [Marinilabiliaceae bacterium]|nr:MFS transporter [Marinilabiliaceae bacterium]